jgi:hypothetical protein
MEADGDRVRRDLEDRRDLLISQLLPRDEPQELLIGGRQRCEGEEGGSIEVLAGAHRRRDVLDPEQRGQSFTSAVSPVVVGKDPPRDGVEPRERLLDGDGLDLAPRDREGLGGDILGIRERLGAAHRVGEHGPLVLAEERVEAGERGTRSQIGHWPRTTGGTTRFPATAVCQDGSVEIQAIAAVVFAVVAGGVVAFQFALALGAPWGAYAMGGSFPGRFPTALRVAAVVQGLVIGLLAVVVLSDAGVAVPDIAAEFPWLIWVPVAVSALAVVLNAISRSAGERRIWVPVAVVLLVSSLVVALG